MPLTGKLFCLSQEPTISYLGGESGSLFNFFSVCVVWLCIFICVGTHCMWTCACGGLKLTFGDFPTLHYIHRGRVSYETQSSQIPASLAVTLL